jgi:hypothetical protein
MLRSTIRKSVIQIALEAEEPKLELAHDDTATTQDREQLSRSPGEAELAALRG